MREKGELRTVDRKQADMAKELSAKQQVALLKILADALEQSDFLWVEASGEYYEVAQYEDPNHRRLSSDPAEWLANVLGFAEQQIETARAEAQQTEASGAASDSPTEDELYDDLHEVHSVHNALQRIRDQQESEARGDDVCPVCANEMYDGVCGVCHSKVESEAPIDED